MKKICLLPILLFTGFFIQAQVQPVEGTVEFQGTKQPATIVELPYPEAVVEKAIEDYLKKKGLKATETRGFKVVRNYKLKDTDEHNSDLYFKTERKSRKEKDITVVYLITAKNGEDLKTRSLDGAAVAIGAAALLTDMNPSIDAYNLEVDITGQEESVKKAEKKAASLEDEQKDLEKRIKNLQDKLAENKNEQVKQKEEIGKQKSILEVLRGKRKVKL